MAKPYIKGGQVYTTNKPYKNDYDLEKFFKSTANKFNIRFIDPCCGKNTTITPVAYNVTATLTAANLNTGTITSTSAAAVSLTLPTATLMSAQLGAVQGDSFSFSINNSSGVNIVTLVPGTGMVVPSTVVVTGSNILTVAAASVGLFRLYFTSATAATIFRIG